MRARSFATNSSLAFTGDLFSKIGLLLVMVIAARTLPTGEVAILGTALAVAGMLAVCLDAGSGLAITRDGARSPEARGGLLAALLAARLPGGGLVLAVAIAVGTAVDAPLVWIGAALLALLGALLVSLTGYFRAARDMVPEAVQKLGFAVLAVALTAVAVTASATADAVLLALSGATAASLVLLLPGAIPAVRRRGRVARVEALRRALPLGLMAIATVVYYRSGTVGLALLSTAEETAAFAVASTVGFGLLMLPNAITTGLLPHLASADADSRASTRRALHWSLALSAPIAAGVALGGNFLLGPVFGAQYADAALPLAILCAAVVVIAYNGVLGTALLAAGHVRVIVLQVVCSLVVNLVALVVLASAFGAAGAATATLLCELVAGAMLTVASARRLPRLDLFPPPAVPTA